MLDISVAVILAAADCSGCTEQHRVADVCSQPELPCREQSGDAVSITLAAVTVAVWGVLRPSDTWSSSALSGTCKQEVSAVETTRALLSKATGFKGVEIC